MEVLAESRGAEGVHQQVAIALEGNAEGTVVKCYVGFKGSALLISPGLCLWAAGKTGTASGTP